MIRELQIENFKSISKLKMSLGRVNVLIGENGSGKSNILEAIAMASAAAADKLDHEFLSSRGIRVPEPQLMRAAFEEKPTEENIKITLIFDTKIVLNCELYLKNELTFSRWVNTKDSVRSRNNLPEIKRELQKKLIKTEGLDAEEAAYFAERLMSFSRAGAINIHQGIFDGLKLIDFFVYCPENTALRNLKDESQIFPLGIRGEGLLSHLKALSSKENLPILKEIESKLSLLNWFEGLKVPAGAESSISIKDRNLPKGVLFDQRSANEGFLFLLFYFTLFISPDTPSFFAIDNIDASLNPKLCATLLKELIGLAEKHNKQVILTTHNPALLDGLDLTDPEQKLFAIERNRNGHTRAIPIEAPVQIAGMEPTRLSESFIRGSIGGLPKNF